MKFVELTDAAGGQLLLNPARVAGLRPTAGDQTIVYLDGSALTLSGTVPEILMRLEGSSTGPSAATVRNAKGYTVRPRHPHWDALFEGYQAYYYHQQVADQPAMSFEVWAADAIQAGIELMLLPLAVQTHAQLRYSLEGWDCAIDGNLSGEWHDTAHAAIKAAWPPDPQLPRSACDGPSLPPVR